MAGSEGATVRTVVEDGVALVTFANGPLNLLTRSLRAAIAERAAAAAGRPPVGGGGVAGGGGASAGGAWPRRGKEGPAPPRDHRPPAEADGGGDSRLLPGRRAGAGPGRR